MTASKIRVLDDQTINKIAAGEVIENPASVVKELVENSIDAGASEIIVEIKGGGRQLIRVSDNGCGMNFDDALLCLERHATSKLHLIEDIHSLLTMGFRGEAIPSIAAISKFMILTSQNEGEGTLVRVEGGQIKTHAKAVRSPGTTLEVASLFFNVPVRKKFQRSPTYDTHEIEKVITKLSLANPTIRFQLVSNEKAILSTPQVPEGDFLMQLGDRIQNTLGTEFYEDLSSVDEEKNGLRLQGYIGHPLNARHNRAEQYLFINKRAVISPLISYAIKEGYGTALPANRYPIYVLHITLPTEYVDVNVHPQKREVRLQQNTVIKEMIFSSIQRSFHHQEPVPAMEVSLPTFTYEPRPFPEIKIEREEEPEAAKEFLFETPKEAYYTPKILSTFNRFILMKTPEDQLALVDQKAARSRILYEQLLKQEGECQMQILLLPITLEMSSLEANAISDHLETFKSMGFDIQEIGKNAFALQAIPATLEEKDIESLILEMARQMESQELEEQERKKKLAQIAARYASTKTLGDLEAALFIKELMRCENSEHCPFGKPIIATLNQEDLFTLFSRKACTKKE